MGRTFRKPTTVSLDTIQILARLGLAALLGAVVGLEREAHGQPAGIRTHALVSTGAALFTLVGAYGFRTGFGHASIDPTRVAAQIVSGIGFIGAGAIVRDGGSVRGITTAAALWATAGLGMACGAGELSIAISALLVVIATLFGLRIAREHGPVTFLRHTQTVDITYRRGYGTLAPIIAAIEGVGASLQHLAIEDGDADRRVHLVVRARHHDHLRTRLSALAELPEVTEITYPLGP